MAEVGAVCPHCGKTMVIPPTVRRLTLRQRKQAKERIHRDAARRERELAASSLPDFRFGRNPTVLAGLMFVLFVVGSLVIYRSGSTLPVRSMARTKESIAAKELRSIRIAVERFRIDIGRYPTTNEGLTALIIDTGDWAWRRPFLTLLKPDPWGKPYQYIPGAVVTGTNGVVTNAATVFSCGPDQRPGTPDDMTAPEPKPEELPWNAVNLLPRYQVVPDVEAEGK